jgi:hypothetical protein
MTSGIKKCDHPACSIAPQPSTLSSVPNDWIIERNLMHKKLRFCPLLVELKALTVLQFENNIPVISLESRMTVRLLLLRTGRGLLPRNIIFLLLILIFLEAE